MLFAWNLVGLSTFTTFVAATTAAPSGSRPATSDLNHVERSTDNDDPAWDGCQYQVENAGAFTSHFAYDFTTMDTLPEELVSSTYTVGISQYAPLARRFDPANIILGGGNPMQMLVPGDQVGVDTLDTSQMVTAFDDVLYASVRTVAQVSPVNGTVHGFFMYMNDTQETDIEIRTGDPGRVYYTNQQTHVGNGESTYSVAGPSDMTTAFHEYRYDWLPTGTNYYIDGEFIMTISRNLPTTPGWLMWNNWACGNAWTYGPPLQDNILWIRSIETYYNRTSVSVNCTSPTTASFTPPAASSTATMSASAGAATSKSAAAAAASTTTSAAPAAATSQTYPDGSTPTINGVTFTIEANTVYSGSLLSLSQKRSTTTTIDTCLQTCSSNLACVGTALNTNSQTCSYYASFDENSRQVSLGTTFATVEVRPSSSSSSMTVSLITSSSVINTPVLTSSSPASKISTSSTLTSSTSTTSSSTTSSTISSTTSSSPTYPALCPSQNSTIYQPPSSSQLYLIECGVDHQGGDLSMLYVSSLQECIATCSQTPSCIDVSLSGAACYMKSSVGAAVSNAGVMGGRLVGGIGGIGVGTVGAMAEGTVTRSVGSVVTASSASSVATATLESTSTASLATADSTTGLSIPAATGFYSRPPFERLIQLHLSAHLVVLAE